MKRLIILCVLSAAGSYSLPSLADTDVTKAVIDRAIEGGFSEL